MRKNLPQLFQLILKHMRNVEHFFLAVNGLNPNRTIDYTTRLLDSFEDIENQVKLFEVQVSLDGIGKIHDNIRGVPGAFERVQDTLNQLQELQNRFPRLKIRLSCVVMPYNLPHMNALDAFAKSRDLPIYYSPVILTDEYYNNVDQANDLTFSNTSRDEARYFFQRLSQDNQTNMRFYYQDMAQMMQGNPRGRRCMMGYYGFVLEHDGQVYPCVNCEMSSFGNLLYDSFENVWFGKKANQVRKDTRSSCCSTCTSMCYPLPVNLGEVIEAGWRRRHATIKVYLDKLRDR